MSDIPPNDTASMTGDAIALPDVSALPEPSIALPGERKSRSGSETRARSLIMRFRLTRAEHAELQEAATETGQEIGAYARAQALAPPESRSGVEYDTSRPDMVPFRVTEEERARIEDAADRAGLSPSSYIRARALKRPVTLTTRRPPVERAELARLLGLIGRVGGNLHQLVKGQNLGRDVPQVDATEAIGEVRAAAAEILRTLGREPRGRKAG